MNKINSDIIIQKAKNDDITGIIEIENYSFEDERFNKRQFLYLINCAKGIFLVATQKHQIAGYISLLKHDKRNNLRIYSIAVHPNARGLHIGNRLINDSISYAKKNNLQCVTLEVDISNNAAINLYEKNGFKKIKILKNYYGEDKDAFYMQCDI